MAAQLETATRSPKYPMKIIEGDGQDIDEFLAKYAPSSNQATVTNAEDETVPTDWIWCRRARTDGSERMSEQQHEDMVAQAAAIEDELRTKCEEIDANDDIPVRASKAKGKSKAQHRAEQHAATKEQLKQLAESTGMRSGKFLFYPTDENCDAQWSKIVKAMLEPEGKLRDSPVFVAKIASTLDEDQKTRVICVYIRDSFDFASVKETFITLVKQVHMVPNSFKADVYTYAGIMSTHPSKIKSTIWDMKDCMSKKEIDDFFESLKAAPAKKTVENESKRALATGGFDAESETEDEEEPPTKKAKK